MKDIVLVGGGGHAKSVIDVIEVQEKYKIIGIIDKKELIGEELLGYKYIGCDDDLEKIFGKCPYAVIGVGHINSNDIRVKLFEKIQKVGFYLPNIISPLAYVSKYAFIDEGSIVMHHALVNADVKVGKNCIINSKSLLEHGVMIGDNSHISTGAIINGDAKVKTNSFIGSGAVVIQGALVSGFIKAGSLVQ